ncbi:MAG: hypothetical protein Q4D06_00460 [Coriobacteriia bacterium]|nr:hypothetical protein [Coriobacteriia bacterium]
MQVETQKPPTRNAVSLRLPPEITQAVDAYARARNVRKTDAYIHFLQLGLRADGVADGGDSSDMRVIQMQLGEVLSILKGECA